MTAAKKQRVYVFDADAFILLNRIDENVMELPKEIWDRLDDLMKKGQLISSRYVYKEIVRESKDPDKLSVWLKPKKEHFPKENNQQVICMSEAVQKFPKLINPENEKEQADPWLVVLACDKNETEQDYEFVVVTQENKGKETNLPAACRHFGVEPISLKEFFKEIGIKFEIA
jgi:hypothetical protein